MGFGHNYSVSLNESSNDSDIFPNYIFIMPSVPNAEFDSEGKSEVECRKRYLYLNDLLSIISSERHCPVVCLLGAPGCRRLVKHLLVPSQPPDPASGCGQILTRGLDSDWLSSGNVVMGNGKAGSLAPSSPLSQHICPESFPATCRMKSRVSAVSLGFGVLYEAIACT